MVISLRAVRLPFFVDHHRSVSLMLSQCRLLIPALVEFHQPFLCRDDCRIWERWVSRPTYCLWSIVTSKPHPVGVCGSNNVARLDTAQPLQPILLLLDDWGGNIVKLIRLSVYTCIWIFSSAILSCCLIRKMSVPPPLHVSFPSQEPLQYTPPLSPAGSDDDEPVPPLPPPTLYESTPFKVRYIIIVCFQKLEITHHPRT